MKVAIYIISFIVAAAIPVFGQTLSAIENELLGHRNNISKYGNYGGLSDYAKVDRENQLLKQKLVRYGRRSDVMKFAFPKLSEKMSITTSKDGRLRIYSWDEETGGTMHDHDSVFQYRDEIGKVHTWATKTSEDVDIGGFYHQIFQVNSKSDPIYLAVSTFIGSSSLSGQGIRVVKIHGQKLDLNARLIRTGSGLQNSISFGYDFFTVVNRPERPIKLFAFNEGRRSFSFPVVIEDEKTPQGRVTDRLITYRFDGQYFFKVQ